MCCTFSDVHDTSMGTRKNGCETIEIKVFRRWFYTVSGHIPLNQKDILVQLFIGDEESGLSIEISLKKGILQRDGMYSFFHGIFD